MAPSVAPTGAAAEEVDRRVVHKMPDHTTDDAVLALVDLGPLNEPLLQRAEGPPDHGVAGALLPVRAQDEAGVVRAERRRKHAGTPRPVQGVRHQRLAEEVGLLAPVHELVDLDDVLEGNHGLLLARVGDLRDRRDGPVIGLLVGCRDAPRVAVADGVDASVALVVCRPEVTVPSLHSERHVHQDPATATGALLAEGLLGHEVVG
eukprot:CAMPEP_0197871468 /NCGR_PEP_ID=MMETSP1439-20131203/1866_1 /TAXON_ID=66791 /ORGANISM="Gonyaulax spinifera, Strain CCMP409" /LENGTH=204 /DNA_ID=CAMNT_0043490403 /DNA_START=57 /DNA_END=667 /DNA_ORIENTATION=+